jgi:hypothetical protein
MFGSHVCHVWQFVHRALRMGSNVGPFSVIFLSYFWTPRGDMLVETG